MNCKRCDNKGYWFEYSKFGYYTIYCVECDSNCKTKPNKEILHKGSK